MAVDSGSVSNHRNGVKSPEKKNGNGVPSSPPKRNKTPAIRVANGRIYDSVNGKTCHQCRQKTRDFGAACKNLRKGKPCPIMYCHKCLLNRYGEKAEEVSSLEEWSCPKCRGICNCSICMKKRGHQPTGILINMAKATGYTSVSEMLLKGGDEVNREKAAEDTVTSMKKEVIVSPKKQGKENSVGGKADANLPDSTNAKCEKAEECPKRKSKQEGFEECPKKMKLDGSAEFSNGCKDEELSKETNVHDNEKKAKKMRKGLEKKDDYEKHDDTLKRRTSPRKLKGPSKVSSQDSDEMVNHEAFESGIKISEDSDTADGKSVMKQHNAQIHADFTLPMGKELISVAGIDVPAEDVGNASQFLEFCAVFGKVLDVKKGQPESVLRDLLHGRTGRRGKFSVTVQFHMLLLSVIQDEQGEVGETLSPTYGKNSWFNKLKEYLSESQSVLKAQGLDSLDQAAHYESLDASQKLRLLNLLCDEVLGTEKIRDWIHEQNTKLAEYVKDAKQKLLAAKNEEKSLKQQMKDDIAKAVIAKHGAPLSISEHEAIISHIKSEATKAHAKVLESKGILQKNDNLTSDALRIEPIFMGGDGCAYWKLKAFGKSNVVCQNVGKGDTISLDEKWSAVDVEGKEALEKHICSLRGKKLRS